MTDTPKPPPGFVKIAGQVVGDGEVRPLDNGNRMFSPDEMRAAFGRHPWADWKPVIHPRRRRR